MSASLGFSSAFSVAADWELGITGMRMALQSLVSLLLLLPGELVWSAEPVLPPPTPSIFADAASSRAFHDVYAVDAQAFAAHVAAVTDPAKAAFLREYMALMQYTAANTEARYDAYMSASDRALDATTKSTVADNLQCQLHLHKAMALMYEGSMLSAGLQFWKAYRCHKSAEKSCPGYDGQLLVRGLFNIVLSQVPEKWKTLKGLLGLDDGNLELGFQQIELYRQRVANIPGLADEAAMFSFANVFFSHDEVLAGQLEALIAENNSPVVRYAYLLTLGRRQKGEAATATLAKCSNDDMQRFPLLLHQQERWALRRGDNATALDYGRRFIAAYAGVSNAANGYLDMAYAHLLRGERPQAQAMVAKCLVTTSSFDIDERSRSEAERLMNCDTALLRARLLYDYGNYQGARDRLLRLHVRQEDLPEWHFRLARAYELLGDTLQALRLYDKTIELSPNSTFYFGPYAAVHAADICLAQHDQQRCRKYALKAQQLNNGEYKKELDQRIELTLRTLDSKK